VKSAALAVLVFAALSSTDARAQGCALTAGRTGTFQTWSNATGAVVFGSGLAVNADGAPNAYHRVLGPTTRDPGLLHVCNGVAVLERGIDGRMVNRYPDFSVPGSSARCKADVFALQERGFPACDSGECLRIFGFFAPPRSCGPGRADECGVPPFATDANGAPTDFFVSTTSLFDPAFAPTDPRRYLDARSVPHFVLPGGERGSFGTQHGVRLGDLALIAQRGRGVFAVFGDAGPADKLGEASPAVITRLAGAPDITSRLPPAIASGVTTLVLAGSRRELAEMPPRSARVIAEAGQRALAAAGGLAAFAGCLGLTTDIVIAAQ
jgi:hypothetical protein